MPIAANSIAMRDSSFSEQFAREVRLDTDVLVSTISSEELRSRQWDSLIDDRLIDWAQHRHEFELNGLTAPSDRAICKAYGLLKFMRDRDWDVPTGVIADGEGGIVFENRRDPVYQRIEISVQGAMHLVTFLNRRMQGVPHAIDIE